MTSYSFSINLELFQSGFRPVYSTETVLDTLADDFWKNQDRSGVSILVLLNLSVAFEFVGHRILLDCGDQKWEALGSSHSVLLQAGSSRGVGGERMP